MKVYKINGVEYTAKEILDNNNLQKLLIDHGIKLPGVDDLVADKYDGTGDINGVNVAREYRLWKYLIFGILTLGMYDLWMIYSMCKDIDRVARSRLANLYIPVVILSIALSLVIPLLGAIASVAIMQSYHHDICKNAVKAADLANIEVRLSEWGHLISLLPFGNLFYIYRLAHAVNHINKATSGRYIYG